MSFYLALVACIAIVAVLSTVNPQPRDSKEDAVPFYISLIHPFLPDVFSIILLGLGLFMIQAENGSGAYTPLFIFWIGVTFVAVLKSFLKLVASVFQTSGNAIETLIEEQQEIGGEQ